MELLQVKSIDKQEFIQLEMQTRTLEGSLQLERIEKTRLETALERVKVKAETSADGIMTLEELLRNERQRSGRLEKDLNAVTEEAQDNVRRLGEVEAKLSSLSNEAVQMKKAFEDKEEHLQLAYQNIATMQRALEEQAASSCDEESDFEEEEEEGVVAEDDEFDDGCMFEAMSASSVGDHLMTNGHSHHVNGDATEAQQLQEPSQNGHAHQNGVVVNGNGYAMSTATESYSSDSVMSPSDEAANERMLEAAT